MNRKTGLALGGGAVAVISAAVGLTRPVPLKAKGPSTLVVENVTDHDVQAYMAFGADSQVLPTDWSFCAGQPRLTCTFSVPSKVGKPLDLGGKYLNATISFAKPVGCGATKAELNLNNPKWYDVVDVSLVDGFNLPVQVSVEDATGGHAFVAKSESGNEKAYGVYPDGCDICVAREHPPCGITPGKNGCKTGTQYKPDVPCQYQGPTMTGGSKVAVRLL